MSQIELDKSPFKEPIIAHYTKFRHTYTRILDIIRSQHGNTFSSKLYGQTITVDWPSVKSKIEEIDARLLIVSR